MIAISIISIMFISGACKAFFPKAFDFSLGSYMVLESWPPSSHSPAPISVLNSRGHGDRL